MIRNIFAISILAMITMLVLGCGPKTSPDESKKCNPHSLTIEATGSHYVKIAWDPGCPTETRIMRGFNIYYSPTPLAKMYPGHQMPDNIKPYNIELYPGDPEGDIKWESFEFEAIPSAQLFYVHVRVQNSDNTLSLPSNEIEMICYPQGTIEIMESYSGDKSGFSFVTDTYCATDAVENDFYFFSKDGKKYLCSPLRVSEINRVSKIYSLGEADNLGDIETISVSGKALDKVEMNVGHVYAVETQDGHFAKLRLLKMENVNGKIKAIFEYFYMAPVIKLYKDA
ncbi:MAG: hypothetical protein KAR42_17495 [candidate division Zixibacteria bacterium]|nr:hypothetical protein [candidate division Zixibacteria bacterium]